MPHAVRVLTDAGLWNRMNWTPFCYFKVYIKSGLLSRLGSHENFPTTSRQPFRIHKFGKYPSISSRIRVHFTVFCAPIDVDAEFGQNGYDWCQWDNLEEQMKLWFCCTSNSFFDAASDSAIYKSIPFRVFLMNGYVCMFKPSVPLCKIYIIRVLQSGK